MHDKENSCPSCHEAGEQGERLSHHSEKTIRELVSRMNRIEGQVRGIKGMIERHSCGRGSYRFAGWFATAGYCCSRP